MADHHERDALAADHPHAAVALDALDTEVCGWRLEAADILAKAGHPAPARDLLGRFVLHLGPPDTAWRHAVLFAQLSVRLREFSPFQQFLRACHGADVVIRLRDLPRDQIAGCAEWTLQDGTSTFTLSARLATHGFAHTIVKHWAWSLPLLLAYARAHPAISGTIKLNLEDKGFRPGLAYSESRPGYFLVPDPYFLGSDAYGQTRREIEGNARPWAERHDIAFWRGATTGWCGTDGREVGHDWEKLPRILLCRLAQASPAPGLYDAGVSVIAQMPPAAAAAIEASGLMRDYVPSSTLAQYKYQIDIDGNTNAWMSLFLKLLSGSPILKVKSPLNFRQWYYDRLKPWYNYVPVRADMADLHAKLLWLRQNDDLAQTIGQRGRALATSMSTQTEIATSFADIHAAFAQARFTAKGRSGKEGQGSALDPPRAEPLKPLT